MQLKYLLSAHFRFFNFTVVSICLIARLFGCSAVVWREKDLPGKQLLLNCGYLTVGTHSNTVPNRTRTTLIIQLMHKHWQTYCTKCSIYIRNTFNKGLTCFCYLHINFFWE